MGCENFLFLFFVDSRWAEWKFENKILLIMIQFSVLIGINFVSEIPSKLKTIEKNSNKTLQDMKKLYSSIIILRIHSRLVLIFHHYMKNSSLYYNKMIPIKILLFCDNFHGTQKKKSKKKFLKYFCQPFDERNFHFY